ncbi:MAG: hypothetical protein KJ904_17660 [Alphaproteobacteria bacterium]|nr:hypothetical protein [Alphaproteobacteria bacterium]MBU0797227.1 hypothetical protein [Alphaproteobacteria bacterium]MBU0888985.1 hypothetical protein [Alphaproteobacteria bacterium]MBU1814005.1 hypothetical protein [Alphaproteobacteria bacterium]MBU2091502.1 hypothetical protein [Alphaproteobacteria bacterium]
MSLCRFLVCLGVLLATPALAQQGNQAPATADPALCARLPGGNAPIDRIARLGGELSVKSLNLTYFGKRLSELTSADFDQIEGITRQCRGGDPAALETVKVFREKVSNANQARQVAARWIRERQAEIKKMGTSSKDLERLQVMWAEMLARSEEMLPADRAPLARDIVVKQDQIYAGTAVPPPPPVWVPKR